MPPPVLTVEDAQQAYTEAHARVARATEDVEQARHHFQACEAEYVAAELERLNGTAPASRCEALRRTLVSARVRYEALQAVGAKVEEDLDAAEHAVLSAQQVARRQAARAEWNTCAEAITASEYEWCRKLG